MPVHAGGELFVYDIAGIGGARVGALDDGEQRSQLVIELRREVERILCCAVPILIKIPFDFGQIRDELLPWRGYVAAIGALHPVVDLRFDPADPRNRIVSLVELVLNFAGKTELLDEVSVGST